MANTQENEEMIDVLCNVRYGGFNLSHEAITLFNKKSDDIKLRYNDTSDDDNNLPDNYILDFFLPRHNPILISVFNELGSERTSGDNCKLVTYSMPKKYENFYKIGESAGKEWVIIDKKGYLLEQTKSIIHNTEKSNDEKINQLKELLKV